MTFKVKDMIRMWNDQLQMYSNLRNQYEWQPDNQDYIFIENQINKLNNLINDANGKTDKQVDTDIQNIFSHAIRTVRQKREHSIINLTKDLEKDEFNYICDYIKNFKMPKKEEPTQARLDEHKSFLESAYERIKDILMKNK
jgi:hypothetical protein